MANEKRLIDANALEYHKFHCVDANDAYRLGWNDAVTAVMENAPTVDAVEVVRCKDCKHGENSINAIGEPSVCCNNPDIGFYEWLVGEDDFCSYGERRTDDVLL